MEYQKKNIHIEPLHGFNKKDISLFDRAGLVFMNLLSESILCGEKQ